MAFCIVFFFYLVRYHIYVITWTHALESARCSYHERLLNCCPPLTRLRLYRFFCQPRHANLTALMIYLFLIASHPISVFIKRSSQPTHLIFMRDGRVFLQLNQHRIYCIFLSKTFLILSFGHPRIRDITWRLQHSSRLDFVLKILTKHWLTLYKVIFCE